MGAQEYCFEKNTLEVFSKLHINEMLLDVLKSIVFTKGK